MLTGFQGAKGLTQSRKEGKGRKETEVSKAAPSPPRLVEVLDGHFQPSQRAQ